MKNKEYIKGIATGVALSLAVGGRRIPGIPVSV